MIPGAEDEILKPDRMEMLQQEQQVLHRSVSEGHLLKTQISIKEEVTWLVALKNLDNCVTSNQKVFHTSLHFGILSYMPILIAKYLK